jgi:EAL domain-containing protein (putative c-di-GMP-specific phosphodiesterase class I)
LLFKAAKRTPAPAPPGPTPAASPPAPVPLTIEALGQQLRDALPTRRLHSLSLCDHEANVLWLSEGALGPDEHSLVTEALAVLAADSSLPAHEMGLEDGRLALFLPVRAPMGEPVGIAMILADRKSIGDDTLERMLAAPVRAIMQRLAVLLKPAEARVGTGTASIPVLEFASEAEVTQPIAAVPAPRAAAAAPVVTPVAVSAVASVISAEQIDDILEFDLFSDSPPAASGPAARAAPAEPPAPEFEPEPQPEPDPDHELAELVELDLDPEPAPAPLPPRVVTAPRFAPAPVAAAPVAPPAREAPTSSPAPAARASVAPRLAPAVPAAAAIAAANDPILTLELLAFAKLRAGGQTRRFQVLARSATVQRDPAAFDALVLQRLIGWLAAHRAAWSSQPTSFTVNLSIATLEDERFAHKTAALLNTHGIAAETLGFEITEALCTQRRAQVERFIGQCDKAGSWVVVDDFSFDSQVLPLLRSKALRLVKIDPKLTSSALKDKLSQAMVVATVQAAKVLGIHCSAKKVDSQAALQWLTAIGCDFAQGQALARAQPLDSLASSPDPTGITAMAMPR